MIVPPEETYIYPGGSNSGAGRVRAGRKAPDSTGLWMNEHVKHGRIQLF
jgi:hypothetical protein